MNYKDVIMHDYDKRKHLYESLSVEHYNQHERLYAYYILGSLGDVDLDISQEELDDFVCNSYRVRKRYSQDVPEQVYLDFVVQPRINNEQRDPTRSRMHEIVAPLCTDDVDATVFAINRWMISKIQYRSTDARTQNAMLTYQMGIGRCGEKSTFLVHALRSIGIPSRQVYAPWWSHCDDRHAWVEVYCNGSWQFIGAGDAVPAFGQGWFVPSVKRALIIHTHQFSNLSHAEPILDSRGIYKRINRTGAYIIDKRVVTIQTTIKSIEKIAIQIVNYGSFRTLVALSGSGPWHVEIGWGEFFIMAEGVDASYCCHVNKTQTTVVLEACHRIIDFVPFSFIQTPMEAKETGNGGIDDASLRIKEQNIAVYEKNRVNHAWEIVNEAELKKLMLALGSESTAEILDVLTEKDHYDFDARYLTEYFHHVDTYRAIYDLEVFHKFILNPRISTETLSNASNDLFNWLEETVQTYDTFLKEASDLNTYQIPDTIIPYTIQKKWGVGSAYDRKHSIVMGLRLKGIPSRYALEEHGIEVYNGNNFIPFPTAQCWKLSMDGCDPLVKRCLVPINLDHDLGHYEITDPVVTRRAGTYHFVESYRMDDGTIRGQITRIVLDQDVTCKGMKRIQDTSDSKSKQVLPDGSETRIPLPTHGILIFGEISDEPTQHIINELLAHAELINNVGLPILYFERTPRKHNLLLKLKASINTFRIIESWSSTWQNTLESMYGFKEQSYPYVYLYHDDQIDLSASGYHVGFIGSVDFMKFVEDINEKNNTRSI